MDTSDKPFALEKTIWNQQDCGKMGWHDCSIYGVTFGKKENQWETDLVFDIDYIFEWVNPNPPEKTFSFWVGPCTLVFKNVFGLHMDIGLQGALRDRFEIASLDLIEKIEREKGISTYRWTLELQEGVIKLESYGFTQIVRKKPLHIKDQQLSMEQRGGISFSQLPVDM